MQGALILALFSVILISSSCLASSQDRSFVIKGNDFYRDGAPFRVVGGSVHYFRIVPEYWSDRLHKVRACGLNTVTTYLPWSIHEPSPGQYDFSGGLDVISFIKKAQQENLLVIIRPAPYICAEFDFGGLPAWLLNKPGLKQVRCSDPRYLESLDKFYSVLLPMLAPFQYDRGGPIIAFQVENEYGYYGNDHTYLTHIKDQMRKHDITSILFASNGAGEAWLKGGTLPELLKTLNYGLGADVAYNFKLLRKYQPTGPLFVTEFWDGWMDYWGGKHQHVSSSSVAQIASTILALNGSINFYMLHGGTNFGFLNGAGLDSKLGYIPIVTSYDYDAPVNESGDATEKCAVIKALTKPYVNLPDVPIPPPTPKAAYGTWKMTQQASILDDEVLNAVASSVTRQPTTATMEELKQSFGFTLYRSWITVGPLTNAHLTIQGLRDRALIFVDNLYHGTLDRNGEPTTYVQISTPKENAKLDILVENQGRINSGNYLMDPKGILEGVLIDGQFVFNWTMYTLPLDNFSTNDIPFSSNVDSSTIIPSFYRGTFNLPQSGDLKDTFLSFPGWTKGTCIINGFNLGRYWKIGPQRTLYLPAPLLKRGINEILLFELSSPSPSLSAVSVPYADLG